jgi:hypothetical protein
MIEGTPVNVSCTGVAPIGKILKLNPLLTNHYTRANGKKSASRPLFAKDKIARQIQIINRKYHFEHGSKNKKRKK